MLHGKEREAVQRAVVHGGEERRGHRIGNVSNLLVTLIKLTDMKVITRLHERLEQRIRIAIKRTIAVVARLTYIEKTARLQPHNSIDASLIAPLADDFLQVIARLLQRVEIELSTHSTLRRTL